MKQRIGVVTSTRADYGILKNTIQRIHSDKELELCLIVTGTHLREEFGYTIDEIYEDGFLVEREIPIIYGKDFNEAQIVGNTVCSFQKAFKELDLSFLVLLGDRYEIMAVAMAAMFEMIPIAHISGGEVTEGAIDDAIRHCITKLSYLHFPACEEYRKRIIQLGEAPERVFDYGDVGIENLYKEKYLSKMELEQSLGVKLQKKYISVTYHPVTLEKEQMEIQIRNILEATKRFPDFLFVFTKANMDGGNLVINQILEEFVEKSENCVLFDSLGIKRYLSLLKYSNGVLGNSSSGIVEAPSLGIPTINIGNRQKGRLQAQSIINSSNDIEDIENAIRKSQEQEFLTMCKRVKNPYGSGETSTLIVDKIKEFLREDKIDLKKKFYDVEFRC